MNKKIINIIVSILVIAVVIAAVLTWVSQKFTLIQSELSAARTNRLSVSATVLPATNPPATSAPTNVSSLGGGTNVSPIQVTNAQPASGFPLDTNLLLGIIRTLISNSVSVSGSVVPVHIMQTNYVTETNRVTVTNRTEVTLTPAAPSGPQSSVHDRLDVPRTEPQQATRPASSSPQAPVSQSLIQPPSVVVNVTNVNVNNNNIQVYNGDALIPQLGVKRPTQPQNIPGVRSAPSTNQTSSGSVENAPVSPVSAPPTLVTPMITNQPAQGFVQRQTLPPGYNWPPTVTPHYVCRPTTTAVYYPSYAALYCSGSRDLSVQTATANLCLQAGAWGYYPRY